MAEEGHHLQAHPDTFFGFLASWRSVLAGLVFCLLVPLLVFLASGREDEDKDDQSLYAAAMAKGYLNTELNNLLVQTKHIAAHIAGTGTQPFAYADLGQLIWPGARLVLFDQHALPIRQQGSEKLFPAGMPSGIFALANNALAGTEDAVFSDHFGEVWMSAAAPAAGPRVHAAMVTLPLDRNRLDHLRVWISSDVEVLVMDSSGLKSRASTIHDLEDNPISGELMQKLSTTREPLAIDRKLQGKTYRAGAIFLRSGQGGESSYLIVTPRPGLVVRSADFPLSACLLSFLGALALFLTLSWHTYRRMVQESETVSEGILDMARHGSPGRELPPAILAAMQSVVTDLRQSRGIADKATEELEECRKLLGSPRRDQLFSGATSYKTFFADSPSAFFRIQENGAFMEVNQAFAMLLGYDSPSHLLSEHTSLVDFCRSREQGEALVSTLLESNRKPVTLPLRRKSGLVRKFTVEAISAFIRNEDATPGIAGFLTETPDDQLSIVSRERDTIRKRSDALALLLAATCRQVQSHLFPYVTEGRTGLPQGSAEPAEGENWVELAGSGPEEGPRGSFPSLYKQMDSAGHKLIFAHEEVFNDLYSIALEESQGLPPTVAPMDIFRVLDQVGGQAMPLLREQGTALYCEAEKDMAHLVHGSALFLRHALLQAIVGVAGPMRGGTGFISVALDPNAERGSRSAQYLFSVSWSKAQAGEAVPENKDRIFEEAASGPAPHEPADQQPGRQDDWSGQGPQALGSAETDISFSEMRAVLQFLVDKMHGELRKDYFSESGRFVSFAARFSTGITLADGEAESWEDDSSLDGSDEGTDQPRDADGEVLYEGHEFYADDEEGILGLIGADPQTPDGEEDARGGQGLDILVIDDNPNNRLLFSMFLRGTRNRITESHSGQQGVEAFRAHKYDVVFINMEMPLMNGYQTTRVIRALEAETGRRMTPIVALTAHILPDFKYQCMLAGCTDFLSKPFSKNALLTMLSAFASMKNEAEKREDAQA